MSHVRRQIREAAATALTGLATTGARVFQSRLRPLRDADLPCLLVNTDDEEIDTLTIGSHPTQERQLALKVRAVAKDASDLDDTLDGIAEQVEPVLNGATLSGKAKKCLLASIRVEMDETLEKPVGTITLEYRVTYFTTPAAPGTAL